MSDSMKKWIAIGFTILSALGAVIWKVDVKAIVCESSPAAVEQVK